MDPLLLCLPNLSNKRWSQDIKDGSFFLGPLSFSWYFSYFQPEEKKNKHEIFSPILVAIQMRSVCTAVQKDVALFWGSDCLLRLDWERTGLVEPWSVGTAWRTGLFASLLSSKQVALLVDWGVAFFCLIFIMDDSSILRRRGLQVSNRKPFYWYPSS